MRIPSGLALDKMAGHGFVAGEQVLDHAGQHMTGMRSTVRGGRSLLKYIARISLRDVERLLENPFFSQNERTLASASGDIVGPWLIK